MSTDEDDALSWAGDEAVEPRPAQDRPSERTARRRAEDTKATEAKAGNRPAVATTTGEGELGSVALVLLGLLGGVHLLYTVGWVVVLAPLNELFGPTDLLGAAMFSLGLVFAAASPLVWFLASLWFTRSRPVWQRIAALVVGAALLVPWPFIVGVR